VLSCSGCWQAREPWQQAECNNLCASLGSIAPYDIAARVEDIVCPQALERSLLGRDKMQSLRHAVTQTSRLPGSMAELGVRQGGSALVMSAAAPGKTLHLFDTWTGLPADCTDGGVHVKGEFAAPERDCREYLAGRNVEFYPGIFPETARGLMGERYSCVHLDADIYESTHSAILYFWSRLVPGGILVCDDWEWPHTPGVTRAVRECFDLGQIEVATRHQLWIRKPGIGETC
jgi:O-methyltransferase